MAQRAVKCMSPLVPMYLKHKRGQGKKPQSNQEGVLTFLATEWDKTGRWCSALDSVFLEDFFVLVDERRIARGLTPIVPVTRRTYASWVRNFLAWGSTRGYFPVAAQEFDPGKTSSRRSKEPFWLTYDQLESIWQNETRPYLRGLFAVSALTCQRGIEMRPIRVGHHKIVPGGEFLIINRTKTMDFGDPLQLIDEAIDELGRYEQWYAKQIGQPLEQGMYLFPKYRGKGEVVHPYEMRGRTGDTVKEMILASMTPEQRADPRVTVGLGSHTLRRSMALALYNRLVERGDMDAMRKVQATLGHTEVTQTQSYLGLASGRGVRNNTFRGFSMRDKPDAEVLQFPRSHTFAAAEGVQLPGEVIHLVQGGA